MRPALSVHAPLAILLLAACGGGGGSSSPEEEPEVQLPTLGFATDSSAPLESAGVLEVELVLSEASAADLQVAFSVAGDAQEGEDWNLLTASPLTLAAGELGGTVRIELLDDDVAFGSLGLTLTLQPPAGGYSLAAQATHAVTLVDDEAPIQEVEANDNLSQAAKNGVLATLTAGSVVSIGGSVVEAGDLFDVHRLQIGPDAGPVRVTATLVGPHPDLLIALTNAIGVPYEDRLDPDAVSFELGPGRLYLVVQSTGAETTYQVRLEAEALP